MFSFDAYRKLARQPALLLVAISAGCFLISGCGGAKPHTAASRNTTPAAAARTEAPALSTASGYQAGNAQVPAAAREKTRIQKTANAIQRMLVAIQAGGGNAHLASYALCKQLSTAAQNQITGSSNPTARAGRCEAVIGSLLEQTAKNPALTAAATGQIVKIRAQGTHAAVTLQLPHNKTADLQFVKEAGTWKLTTTDTGN